MPLQFFAERTRSDERLLQVPSGDKVKPDEKKRFINELENDQNIVAMVGDGINDAAALASSHLGAASEVSSVVLMGNILSQLEAKVERLEAQMQAKDRERG